MQTHIDVLFVCLGNICRSPMAEAIFRQRITDAGLADRIAIDSVGIGDWHIGEPPHRGTQNILRQHGIPFAGSARQITHDDLGAEYLIAMDSQNLRDLHALLSSRTHPHLHRLLEFAPTGAPADVPDPYFDNNFEYVFDLVSAGCDGLLAHIRRNHDL